MAEIEQKQESHSTPGAYYAVTWGNQRGVFASFREAQAAMKGFPNPVSKKFKTREEAEDYYKRSQPESTSALIEADENDKHFHVVARGKVIGIFKDNETVKKHTKGFPQAMHKKFDSLEEAKRYLEKFSEGKLDEKEMKKKSSPKKRTRAEADAGAVEGEEKEEETSNGVETKSIARKRTAKVDGIVESGGTGQQEEAQTNEEGNSEMHNESNNIAADVDKTATEVEETKTNGESKANNGGEEPIQSKAEEEVKAGVANVAIAEDPSVGEASKKEAEGDEKQEKLEEGEEPNKKAKLDVGTTRDQDEQQK